MNIDKLVIPGAIVVAGALIAGAIYLGGVTGRESNVTEIEDEPSEESEEQLDVRALEEGDHLRGSADAKIVLIEYSDYDCPFCQQFHETLRQIMDEYGANGSVAWAYRHFPIEGLHPNAPKIAEAAECVAELGGNDAFWIFSDTVFSSRPINTPTDVSRLPEFAATAGVEENAFEQCLESGKNTEKILASIQEAANSGAGGTPHTLVFLDGEFAGAINGAQPYEAIKQGIDEMLAE